MKNLKILAYHRILPEARNALSVHTRDFEKHIRFFIKNGWECLTLRELSDLYLKKNRKLDRKIFVITFDDGYRNNYEHAYPILRKYGIRATIFLTVDYIGKHKPFYWDKSHLPGIITDDYPLDWDEVCEMKKYGIEFGSHTLTHLELANIRLDDARRQICESKAILDSKLSQNTVSFCYPKGSMNENICRLVKEANYEIAVITPPVAGIEEANFTLKRVGLYNKDSFLMFRLKISVLFSLLRETKLWHIHRKR